MDGSETKETVTVTIDGDAIFINGRWVCGFIGQQPGIAPKTTYEVSKKRLLEVIEAGRDGSSK